MAFTFSDSFGGVSFRILREDNEEAQEGLISVRKIPGGNNTYVDFGGLQPKARTYNLHIEDDADFRTLETKVGTSGTLVDTTGGNVSVLLMSVRRATRSPGGHNIVRAEFILT